MRHSSKARRGVALAVAGALAISISVAAGAAPSGATSHVSAPAAMPAGLTKIKHVVVVMQENRSYDSYFGQLHNEGQPASPAEPTTGNPDPLIPGNTIAPFLVATSARSPT